MISVIITGATGSAGSGVLHVCLAHPAVQKITLLVRRSTGISDEKITEVIHGDFTRYEGLEDRLKGHDACYWCLGTSSMKVRNPDDYYRITYTYTIEAAKILEKLNPGMTFCFLSGMGTDETGKSRMMWARVKGKAEADLGNYKLDLYNFRPGFIHPVKGQRGSVLGSLLYPFIKNSRRMCVESDEFGQAMIHATLYGYERKTLENPDIRTLAAENRY